MVEAPLDSNQTRQLTLPRPSWHSGALLSFEDALRPAEEGYTHAAVSLKRLFHRELAHDQPRSLL